MTVLLCHSCFLLYPTASFYLPLKIIPLFFSFFSLISFLLSFFCVDFFHFLFFYSFPSLSFISFPFSFPFRSVPFLSYLFFFIRSSSPLFLFQSSLPFRSVLLCSPLLLSSLNFSLSPPGHHEVHDISGLCSDMIWFSRLNQLLNLTRNQDRINIMSKEN